MSVIQDFLVRIKTEGANQLNNVRKSVDGLTTDLQNLAAVGGPLSNTIGGIVGKLGPLGLAAAAAGGAFAALGLRAISLADELDDVSNATGISAGALNNFKNSLIDAGGQAADFSTLAAKLNQNLGEAATGNETAQKAFQKLGVFVRDAGGKVRDTGDVLRDAIGKLAAIEDPAIRAAMAVDLFGKNAAKLDFKQLNAANDPFTDEKIKQLAKYQTAIDTLSKTINNQLITSFGGLAKSVNEFLKEYDSQGFDAFINRLTVASLRLSGFGKEADKVREKLKADIKAKTETDAETQKLLRLSQTPGAPAFTLPPKPKGDFGADSEAKIKANKDSAMRAAQSRIEADTNLELQGANEILAIQIKARDDLRKAANTIYAQEKVSNEQILKEYAAKEKEINSKAALDIAKIRSQTNAKVFTEEEAQRQKIQEELAAEEERLNKLFEAGRKITEQAAEQNKELAAKAKLALDSVTLTDRERANAEELFKIEQDRLALLKQIKDTYGDNEFAKRTEEEKKINDLLNKRKEDAVANQQATAEQQDNFSLGWEKAYRQYVESSKNGFAQAGSLFSTLSRGFEDSIVKFVQTGKLSFKDLFNDLIAQAVRAQSNRLLTSLLGSFGGFFGSFFGGITGGGGGGAMANGGPVQGNTPYLIGERGPELFVPRTSGDIIPNNKLGGGGQTVNTAVTYNISAVDASSFRSLLARDPEFIHNVAEQGRRSLPIRSRR